MEENILSDSVSRVSPQEKLKSFISKLRQRKLLGALSIAAIVMAIPLTVFVAGQQQVLKQRATELQVEVLNAPSGTIGVNKSLERYSPTITLSGNGQRIYVFVIGEGNKNKDGSPTNKPAYDWFHLYETHSDTNGDTWTPYASLDGILSTPVTTTVENGVLYLYAKGWDVSDPNDPKDESEKNKNGNNIAVNIYSRREVNGSFHGWETVNPMNPQYIAAGEPRTKRQTTLQLNNGMSFSIQAEDATGKLLITRSKP